MAEMSDAGDGAADEVPVLISFNLLQSVMTARSVHGLRHENYERYRKYCTRRLRRLYKALKLLHGRGKYQKRKLESAQVVDSRYISVPLLTAERAWGYAMELKDSGDRRKKVHLVRRIVKAAYWGSELARLAEERCDERTALEAQAYSLWLSGSAAVEKSAWEVALSKLVPAQNLLEKLSGVGGFEQQNACRTLLQEVEPVIRLCKYEINRAGGSANQLALAAEGASLREKALKLDALAQSGDQSGGQAASVLNWRGTAYPVVNDKARCHLQQALQHTKAAEEQGLGQAPDADLDVRLAAFDGIINAYAEMRAAVRNALRAASDLEGRQDASAEALQQLSVAVSGTLLERSIERNLVLVSATRLRISRAPVREEGSGKAKDKELTSSLEDIIRLYETLLANVKDLTELATEAGGAAGEVLLDECAAKAAQFQASKCFFVAQFYLATSKLVEAHALFQRCLDRLSAAVEKHQECARPDEAELRECAQLQAQASAFLGVAHAERVAEELRAKQALQEGVGAISLDQVDSSEGGPISYLPDNLDRWESFAGKGGKDVRIFPVPPPPVAIPVRPFMLDSAQSYIEMPSLQHRIQKKADQKTSLARFFSWRS